MKNATNSMGRKEYSLVIFTINIDKLIIEVVTGDSQKFVEIFFCESQTQKLPSYLFIYFLFLGKCFSSAQSYFFLIDDCWTDVKLYLQVPEKESPISWTFFSCKNPYNVGTFHSLLLPIIPGWHRAYCNG